MKLDALLSEGDVNLTRERAEWISMLSIQSHKLLEEDEKYFLRQSLSTPCLNNITSSNGIYIYDAEERRYIDFHGNSVHQLGYNNRFIIDRMQAQMDKLSFSPRRYANEKATACAKRLTELAPGDLNKVLFTPGGASSISVALKLARIYTGRYKIISMYDAFHGANLDTISVGGEQLFRNDIGPLMGGTILVPPIDTYRGYMGLNKYMNCEELLLDQITYILEKEGDVAALLAEPIRSTSVHVPSNGFWKKVKFLCEKHGALLIFDEIPTSMGRTGKLFSTENFDVVPDILIVGKGLAAGLIPFSAVLVNERFDVAPEKALGHYTFEKNPLASEATLAALDFIDQNHLLDHCKEMERYMNHRLKLLKERFDIVGDVRGIGLLWAIEIVEDRVNKKGASHLATQLFYKILEGGVSFKVSSGSVLILTPPITIRQDQLEEALDIIENAFLSING